MLCTCRQPFQMSGIENLFTDEAADKERLSLELSLISGKHFLRHTEIRARFL